MEAKINDCDTMTTKVITIERNGRRRELAVSIVIGVVVVTIVKIGSHRTQPTKGGRGGEQRGECKPTEDGCVETEQYRRC